MIERDTAGGDLPQRHVRRRTDKLAGDGHARVLQQRARPKSVRLSRPFAERSKFEGLMSRWITPLL
jgi:hypothetical protein